MIPETRYVVTDDGLHIGYQVFGAGPYDLVFNDVLSNVDAGWDVPSWAATLRAFGRRARVITFDRRGFGVSDRPTSPDALSLELGVDDLRAVMDATGATKPVIMGFEWGCALSLLFAASYPERTAGLVLLSPVVSYWRTLDHPWGHRVEEADRTADPDLDWGATETWRASLLEMNADDAEASAWAKWARLVASPLARRTMRRVEQQTDVRSLLPSIQVPTLILQKAGDHARAEGGGPAAWVASQIPGARFALVPGPEDWPTARDTELFDAIDGFAGEIRERQAEFDRVLATVLFTDIVDSTARAAHVGDRAWTELVERHHAIVRTLLRQYRGVEVDTAGDGFFATFDGPARAVRCAAAIIDAVRPLGIAVRAGCHTGEVETIDGKAGGLAVNVGARVAGLAGPGEILVSSTVKDLTAGSGLAYSDAGEHPLKGVPDAWRLYRVIR